MMRYYLINEKRLKELLIAEMKLIELERDGVDNWEWYGEGRENYLKELATGYELEYNEELEYEDIAEKDLENFEFYKEDF